MALYGGLDQTKHLDEFNTPLPTAQGVLSAAARRALAIANLFGGDDSPAVEFPDDMTVVGATVLEGTANVEGVFTAEGTAVFEDTVEFEAAVQNTTDVGTVTTGATTVAHEGGDGIWHETLLTMTNFSMGNVGDNASLGIGAKFYTFPAGEIVVKDMVLAGTFSAAVSVTAQTPEYGIGSTIGTGATATLGTTLETYIDGGAAGGMVGGTAVLADLTGAVVHAKSTLAANTEGFWIKASGGLTHDLFLNAACAWADIDAVAPLLFTGTISFRWRKIT